MQIRTPSLCLALVAGLGMASVAHAVDTDNANAATTPDTTLFFNGVKIAIDPVSGRLRQPTAEELQALRESVKAMPFARGRDRARNSGMPATRMQGERTVRRLPDGRLKARVSDDMLNSIVATRNADGSLTLSESGELPVQGADHE